MRRESTAMTSKARPATDRFGPSARLIFVVAVCVRAAHLWSMRESPFARVLLGDAAVYDAWARQIAGGDWIGHDVFYQAPLYAYFLGAIYWFRHSLPLLRALQALVGAAACVSLGYAAHRVFGRSAGLAAGMMLACYAPAVFFDSLVQKSVLDIFLICLVLALLSDPVADAKRPGGGRRWLGIGLTLGALGLTRENALLFVPVVIAWIWLSPSARDGRRARRTMALLAGVLLMVLPAGVRNAVVGGEFHVTTMQAGPNLFIGNNPRADGTYVSLRFGRGSPEFERQDAVELASRAAGRPLSPGEVSQYWTLRAIGYVRREPLQWLRLEGRKLWLLANATEVIDTESQESHEDDSLPLRLLARVAISACWRRSRVSAYG